MIATQYYHGIFFKILAILCKIIFLFYVVPQLDDQVFSRYVYFLTVSLLISRCICWGANDQIPVSVPVRDIHRLDFWVFFFLVLSVLSLLISMGLKSDWVACFSIVIMMITETLMEGMLILISMKTYEKLMNIPWILFLVIVLLFPVTDTRDLLVFYNLAYVMTHGVVFFIFLEVRYKTFFALRYRITEMFKLVRGGYLKVMNQLLILVNIRGLILLPKLLTGSVVSDAIALGITIAEAFSTLFMVPVNRNFSTYCKAKIPVRTVFSNALKITTGFWMAGFAILVCGYLALWINHHTLFLPMDKIQPLLIFSSFGIFSAMLGFTEIRNYYWARKQKELFFLAILVLAFVFQGICLFITTVSLAVFIIPAVLSGTLLLFLIQRLAGRKPALG